MSIQIESSKSNSKIYVRKVTFSDTVKEYDLPPEHKKAIQDNTYKFPLFNNDEELQSFMLEDYDDDSEMVQQARQARVLAIRQQQQVEEDDQDADNIEQFEEGDMKDQPNDDDDDGIQFEPFNMQQERSEGMLSQYSEDYTHFLSRRDRNLHNTIIKKDEQKKDDEDLDDDPWMKSVNGKVPEQQKKAMMQNFQQNQKIFAYLDQQDNDECELSLREIARIKYDIAKLLEENEKVQQGLKRLSQKCKQHKDRCKKLGLQKDLEMEKSQMQFDQIQDLSDLIISSGDYDIYNSTKKQLQDSAEFFGFIKEEPSQQIDNQKQQQPQEQQQSQQQQLQQQQEQQIQQQNNGIQQQKQIQDFDMFALDDDEGQENTSSNQVKQSSEAKNDLLNDQHRDDKIEFLSIKPDKSMNNQNTNMTKTQDNDKIQGGNGNNVDNQVLVSKKRIPTNSEELDQDYIQPQKSQKLDDQRKSYNNQNQNSQQLNIENVQKQQQQYESLKNENGGNLGLENGVRNSIKINNQKGEHDGDDSGASDFSMWPLNELQRFLKERGVDTAKYFEKEELVSKVQEIASQGPEGEVATNIPLGYSFDASSGYYYNQDYYYDPTTEYYYSTQDESWYYYESSNKQYVKVQ